MTVHQFEAGAAGAQGYAINWDTAETRVKELKAYLMNAPQVMNPERLQFLNEVYEEFQGEPVFYIRAKLLERVLLKKKIFLDGNPIVGTLTGTRAGVYAYPEWNVSWIKEEMQMAKMASLGQKMQNRLLGFIPEVWKRRMQSPLFSGRGPKVGYTNLYEALRLHRGSVFSPSEVAQGTPCVIYFPGCGGGLFYDRIGLSSIMLLLRAGFAVAVPPRHLCCGYPLLAAGMDTAFEDNLSHNRQYLSAMIRNLGKQGFEVAHLVTSCGTCLDGLERIGLTEQFTGLGQRDVLQLVLPLLKKEQLEHPLPPGTSLIYHASCHSEWAGIPAAKGQKQIVAALSNFSGAKVLLNGGCCGESGMGALTSPQIYNLLRSRKQISLQRTFAEIDGPEAQAGKSGTLPPVLVGCPSCKIGIGRCLINLHDKRPVLHVAEWVAGMMDGEDRRQSFRRRVNETRGDVRVVKG